MWDEGMQISLLWPQPVPLLNQPMLLEELGWGLKGDFEGELWARLWQTHLLVSQPSETLGRTLGI